MKHETPLFGWISIAIQPSRKEFFSEKPIRRHALLSGFREPWGKKTGSTCLKSKMKESYSEILVRYAGPESYADGGNTVGVVTAGVHLGGRDGLQRKLQVRPMRKIERSAAATLPTRLTVLRPRAG